MKKINTIIRRFWWTGVQEEQETSPIAYRSWDDICKPTVQGGLGIRDMETVNKSLIIHSAWNIANNKNPFLTTILKAKYFPSNSFWTAPNRGPRSIFWSSVMQVRQHILSNATYQLHAGNSSIWSSPWSPIWSNIYDHLLTPVVTNPLPAKVSDLWIHGTNNWDHLLLSTTFTEQAVQIIEAIPVVNSDQDDILRWSPASNGQCTTKAAYSYLANQEVHQLPSQGSRSISHDANLILQKVWKYKSIPPILKTFAWRLIRRAVATGKEQEDSPIILIKIVLIVGLLKMIFIFSSTVISLDRFGPRRHRLYQLT